MLASHTKTGFPSFGGLFLSTNVIQSEILSLWEVSEDSLADDHFNFHASFFITVVRRNIFFLLLISLFQVLYKVLYFEGIFKTRVALIVIMIAPHNLLGK